MDVVFARSWQALALRGGAGIAFGLVAILRPGITLSALVLLFGAYSLCDGILAIAAATRQESRERVSLLVIEGLVGVGIGLAALLWTGITALVLMNLISLWAILTGVLEIVVAVKLRAELPGEFLLGMAGAASLALGVLMLRWPDTGAFVIVVLLGSYALFFGASMLALALRLRRLLTDVDAGHRSERHHAV